MTQHANTIILTNVIIPASELQKKIISGIHWSRESNFQIKVNTESINGRLISPEPTKKPVKKDNKYLNIIDLSKINHNIFLCISI